MSSSVSNTVRLARPRFIRWKRKPGESCLRRRGMGDLRVGAALYSEPLKLIQRLVSVRRHLSRDEEHRDEVSRIILSVLALKGPQNISALTREVQRERGTGSRVTVRKRVMELVDTGLVEKAEGHSYRLIE